MLQQKDGRRAIIDTVAALANWPQSAPSAIKWLVRHRRARTILRRLPFKAALRALPPAIYGEIRRQNQQTICIVSNSLAASGAPKVVFDIALDLIGHGYNVIVLSPTDGPYRSMLVEAGAVVMVDGEVLTGRSQAISVIRTVDAVVCNTIWCLGIVDHAGRDVPIFWYIHEAALVEDLFETHPEWRRFLKTPRAVWAVSDLAAAHIRHSRPDVGVLVPGTAALRPPSAVPPINPEAVVRLAVFGGLEPRKGQDLLVSAVELLTKDEQASLAITIYGAVMERTYADTLFRSIQRTPNINYGGCLAPHEVADKVIAVDGVIVPSRNEPLPLVAVEVLSVSRVLLCSTCCGIAANLVDGENGFVAENCNPESLASMLRRAIAQKADWRAIAENGYQTYLRRFTREHMTSQIISAIEGVLSHDQPSSPLSFTST